MGKPEFRTRSDGTVYPLNGKTRKVGSVALAIGVSTALGMSSGTIGLGSVGTGGGAQLSATLRPNVTKARTAAAKGQRAKAWRKIKLRKTKRRIRLHQSCVAHSYGQVRSFFVTSPCRSLRRMKFWLEDGAGNSMVVSVAWVRMPATSSAVALKRIVDTHGTGNVAPIAMRAMQAHGIAITGDNYASRRSRQLVVIAEAERTAGHPGEQTLDTTAFVASRFPRP